MRRLTLNLHSNPTGTNVILILQMETRPEEVRGLARSVLRYHIPWPLNAALTPLFISQEEKGTSRYQVGPRVTCATCLKAALARLRGWLPGQNADMKHCCAKGQTGVWNRKVAFSSVRLDFHHGIAFREHLRCWCGVAQRFAFLDQWFTHLFGIVGPSAHRPAPALLRGRLTNAQGSPGRKLLVSILRYW